MVAVKDVFVAGGMPKVTYVSRASLNLERDLRREITEGYKVICVTGPTKSGKTVLTRHILGVDTSAKVEGGHVKSSEEFWSLLLQDLQLPIEHSIANSSENSASFKWLISASTKLSEGETVKYNNLNKQSILKYMIKNNLALVVDDFHYMPTDIQKEVVRALKSAIFDGLTAILIAVPHRAFDAIGVEREMEGRFAHIEIPSWRIEELKDIARQGFPALNMRVDPSCIMEFAKESNGSPLLMQRFCGRLCQNYDVHEKMSYEREFNPSDSVRVEIYEGVAKQFGFPSFEKLSKGPQSRSRRIDRNLAGGGGSMDIYQAVLRAVSMTGPKEKIHYNEIRDQLKSLLEEPNVPQKHEVSAALGHMSGIAKDGIEGEPVLEWSDDYLYITDPFLMFYMRWIQRGDAAK